MNCKVDFDSLPWQAPAPGVRFKAFQSAHRQLRLVEFSSEFAEREWCEKQHIGLVLRGELELEFRGSRVRYAEGSGIFICGGDNHAHKARSLTPSVLLFLVEEI